MDLKLAQQIVALLDAQHPLALVSTLATRGSSPRKPGAWMLVKEDGTTLGTVGGGPLEARAISAALDALRDGHGRLLEFVLTEEDATGLGMTCGGEAAVLVQPILPVQAAVAMPVFAAAMALLKGGQPGWVITEVKKLRQLDRAAAGPPPSGPGAGQEAQESTATLSWSLPPGQSLVRVRRAVADAAGGVTGDLILSDQAANILATTGTLDSLGEVMEPADVKLYVEPLSAPETAYIFGAGHCGQALAPLLKMIGLQVVVVDDREEFANSERFPQADAFVLPPAFDVALEKLPVDERSYLVIMTRCHALDRTVLAQALKTDARYVGMIGSRRKVAGIFAALKEQGFTDQDLSRVRAPIGLEIGAETPEEIAVSIAAEIVQVRRGANP